MTAAVTRYVLSVTDDLSRSPISAIASATSGVGLAASSSVTLCTLVVAVNEHHTFQVIHLVLEDARQVVLGLDALRPAVGVLPADDDLHVAFDVAHEAGDGEAPFLAFFLVAEALTIQG